MRSLTFSKRCLKEILRDPLTLFFGLGFPVVLILLLSTIQKNIPVSLFEIDELAPGMIVFGLTFITLFSALLVSKDRETAFLMRLYATPMTAVDFILGYTLPILPVAVAQAVICLLTGVFFGLKLSVNMLYVILAVIPLAVFFVGFGLLCGSIFNSKAVGGICGALFANISAWLSGLWFDLKLVGGVLENIANVLPFMNGVKLLQLLYDGSFGDIWGHLAVVCAYAAVTFILAVVVFLKQMKKA